MLQESASAAVRDLEGRDRQRAVRARDLASCGGVISARLLEAAPGAGQPDDLCEFEVEVAGSQGAANGARYDVRLRAGRLSAAMLPATCSCPDFARRGSGPCKHIGAAWRCAVDGNFSELLELSLAAGRREASGGSVTRRAAPAGGDQTGLAKAVREQHDMFWNALRDSEAEVALLRAEVLQLREEAAAPAGRGVAVDFLTAQGTLGEWSRACEKAESYVMVACFTFDHPAVVGYLELARTRGLLVRVLFSGRDKALTNNQGPRLQRLRACGCEVRAHKGSRLHAKVMLTEQVVVLGSCNFTTSSVANAERGVLLRGLTAEQLLEQRQWYEQLWEVAAPFKDGIGQVVPPSPER